MRGGGSSFWASAVDPEEFHSQPWKPNGKPEVRNPPVVFVSYCQKDIKWLNKLRLHLATLAQRVELEVWDDTEIAPGDSWRSAIEDAIRRARVAILLVSADFLASDFIRHTELPLLKRKRDLKILWVLVSPCLFSENSDLAGIQAFNNSKTALTRLPDSEQEAMLAALAKTTADVIRAETLSTRTRRPKPQSTTDDRSASTTQLPKGESKPLLQNRTVLFTGTAPELESPVGSVGGQSGLTELAGGVRDLADDPTLNWFRTPAAQSPNAALRTSSDLFPRARQLPVVGLFFLGCRTVCDWIIDQLWSNQTFQQIVLVVLLLTSGILPAFVVYARYRGWRVPHLGWLILAFVLFGPVAIGAGTVLARDFKRDAAAAALAPRDLHRLSVQHPLAFRKLESMWDQLPDSERTDVESTVPRVSDKLTPDLRADFGSDLKVFVTAKLALSQSPGLTAVLSVLTIFLGLESIVCSAILGAGWLSEPKPAAA